MNMHKWLLSSSKQKELYADSIRSERKSYWGNDIEIFVTNILIILINNTTVSICSSETPGS